MKKLILATLLTCCITTQLSGCGPSESLQAQTTPSTLATKDLSAYVNTYWYVPSDYLLAYAYNANTTPKLSTVNDQTIWHITSSNGGYLMGCSYASVNNGATWAPSTLIGSVTTNNTVSIGFYGNTLTVGSGQLTSSSGQPVFLMQMSTGSGGSGLTHWAYMLPITPADAAWNNLPGTGGLSVTAAVAGGC